MGWTFTRKEKNETVLQFFENSFNYTREDGSYGKILKCKVVGMKTAYMAYEIKQADPAAVKIVALVCLLEYRPKDYWYNFGYKDMDETVGPCESNCPEDILKMLTPTDYEYAIEWRKRCYENLAKKKAVPKLKDGMKITVDPPIYYGSGYGYVSEFMIYDAKRMTASSKGYGLYKLSRKVLSSRTVTVIN